jgi:hypothetical protein
MPAIGAPGHVCTTLNSQFAAIVAKHFYNKHMKRRTAAISKFTRQIMVCAAVFAVFSSGARAEEMSPPDGGNALLLRITIQVPLYSRHIPQDAGFNDHNLGVLVEASLDTDWSIIVGEFRNSYYRDTAIAASRYSLFAWDYSSIRVDTGVMLGFDLNGGYQGHNGVDPLLGALSIKITGNRYSEHELLNRTGVAFTILPGKIVVANVALVFGL